MARRSWLWISVLSTALASLVGAAAPPSDDGGADATRTTSDDSGPEAAADASAETAPIPAAPTSPPGAASARPAPDGSAPLLDSPTLHSAFVHVHVSYPDAVLELRSYIDETEWKEACRAPCDRTLRVEGMDARVLAPGMTTSNAFRIEPGRGSANLKVEGGSARSRTIGTVGFAGGIPVALAGMGLWGYGKIEDKAGLRAAGLVTMGVAAVMILGSLPFLSAGSTKVRDGKGKTIAGRFAPPEL